MNRRDLPPLKCKGEILGDPDRVVFRTLGLAPAIAGTHKPFDLPKYHEQSVVPGVLRDLVNQSIESRPFVGIQVNRTSPFSSTTLVSRKLPTGMSRRRNRERTSGNV